MPNLFLHLTSSPEPIGTWPVAGRCQSSPGHYVPFADETHIYSQIIMTVVYGHKRSNIRSSLQGFLYMVVVYIYLLFYCRGNRTPLWGLLGLISPISRCL